MRDYYFERSQPPPNHAANPAIALRLQFTRPVGRVAELPLGGTTLMADNPPIPPDEVDAIATEASILTHLLCFECERHFEQASESVIEDVETWSYDVAARAIRAGWRFADRKIFCPDCWSRRK